MKIKTLTYFENNEQTCGQAYDSIIEEGLSFNSFLSNPDSIDVCNEIYDDEIFIINSHEFGDFIKYIEGVNRWSADNYITVGAWHIKYKNKC